ncbi:MAG: hypothetical protein HPY59_01435 [Anaerolineae bacterium]|nr:hypothetical protein [Anaerolineae bacterium]
MHKFWQILSLILSSLTATWPASRFRRNWMAIMLHAIEAIPVLVLVTLLVLELYP